MLHKIGIVGCGGIAQVHAAALARLENTQLIACADIRPERAQAMAEKYGCRAYASMEEMLEKESLDAVHLCTPHYLHTPMAQMAAEKGLAVFTEKPPVISREQWAQLEEAAKKTPLGVCFQNRYNPNVRAAERIVASGEYGALVGARAIVNWYRTAPYYTESGWRGAWDTEGGGALINQAIHTLDLMVRFLGAPQRVEAHMANHHLKNVIQVEDTVEAYLVLGGKPALFYASTAYTQNAPIMLELQLEKATLRIEEEELAIRTDAGWRHETFPVPATLGKDYWGSGHLVCIRDFYDALEQHRPFQNDIASVRNTIETYLQMYEQGKAQLTAEK